MRIIGRVGAYNAAACAVSGSTGQMEDYTITIQDPCTGNLNPGNTLTTATSVCPNTPFTLSLQNTVQDGASYTWQTSPSGNTGTWTSATATPTNFFGTEVFNTTNPDANVYGVASIEGGQLVLTPATNSLLGAYVIQKTPGTNINAFTVNFDYQIPTTGGADGFSLSYAGDVQNDAAGGESGSGTGLIIQFDTYDNEGVSGGGSRIRIQYGGNTNTIYNSAMNVPPLRPTTGDTPVVLKVDAAGKLSLSVNGTVVVSDLALPAAYLAANKSAWRFKFSARTGGSNDRHIIDNLLIRYLDVNSMGSTFTTSQTVRTFYRVMVTCGSTTQYSTAIPVDVTSATINPMTANACSGVAFTVTPANGTNGTIPSGTTYTWTAPTVTGGITGGAASTGTPSSITGNLTNPTATAQTATYTVTPITGTCTGIPFTLTVTVNPLPTPTFTAQPGSPVCPGVDVTYTTQASMTNYVWGFPGVLNTDYAIVSGGSTTSNTVTLRYLTAGSKTVTINYRNGNGCTAITSTSSNAITVNPVHSITPTTVVDRYVCPNTAMTPITMTLGGGATGANVTGLPVGISSSVSGTTLTISGTPAATITGAEFNYSVTTTGNACTAATASGKITVGIGNNLLTYTNGTSGTVCINPAENNTTPENFTAPAGTYFNSVSFASYGTPTGSCGSFVLNYSCHSTTSQQAVENAILGNSGTSQILPSNSVFGDPCNGTVKRLYASANYSQAICAGTNAGTISGTPPTGNGGYTYQWQRSTTGASGSYTNISGTNTQNYSPGVLTQTTYFQRIVTSGGCTSTSPAVVIKVNPLPTSVVSGTTSICSGSSATVSVALIGTAPWSLSYSDGTTTTNATNITASPFTFSVSPTNTRTYTVSSLNDANCSAVASGMTGNAVITVNARPTAAVSGSATICSGASTPVSVTFTGTGPWNFSYTYGAVNGTFSTSSNPYTVNVNPTSNTTYSITALSDANCTAAAGGITGNAVITVNPRPTAPTVAKTDISCGVSGSVTLSNLPSGSWTIHQTGQAIQDITGTTASRTISGLAAGSYSFTVENSNGCISNSAPAIINDNTSSTTWNGSGWSNGPPDANKTVTISSASTQPFTGTPTNIAACSLIITSATDVIIPSGFTFTVTNSITSNGKLVFKNNSSLIQTTNAVNTGDIVYERTTSIARYDLTYWAMPVTKAGFTMGTFSPNTLYDKYFYWDNVNQRWLVDPSGASVAMQVGKGYSIRGPQTFDIVTPSVFTGIFTGVPNNGNIGIAVEADKWNLIGNPYPSAVDAYDLLGPGNNPQLGALYLWSHASPPTIIPGTNTYRYASSDFIVYTRTGSTRLGTSINGGFNGKIAAGQAFFAKPTGVSTVNFVNTLRRGASDNTQFYKTATNETEMNRIWLNLTNSEGAFKQTLLGYVEDATNGIDISFDATTMSGNTYVDFYSVNESKKLTIQGRALPFDNSDLVPLGYKTTIEGELTIGIDHVDGLFENQDIYLEDKVTGIITDLRKENYKFTTAIGTSTTRFVLRYTNKTLGVDNPEDLENSVLVSAKDQTVKITSSKEIIKEVNIYNVGAQLLYTKNKVNSSELQISNLHSTDQVILVKVTLENGYTFTKKVIFSNLK